VDRAAARQDPPVSRDGVYYLANLLVERGRTGDRGSEVATLAELHMRARAAPPGEALEAWRELGDKALYTSGFFRQSLMRSLVGVRYYLDMGASAYQALARRIGGLSSARGMGAVFEELAGRFGTCSELLLDVRDEVRSHSDRGIVELYEEWLATGSRRAAELLVKAGVVPGRQEEGGSC
jgi:hypothetical protein